MQKLTIEQLSLLLAQQPANTVIKVKSRNSSNGLNANPTDGSARGKNPYYKNDALVKVSITEGRINYNWTEERKQDTKDAEYTPTKSNGIGIGGLTVAKNGQQAISMIDASTKEVEWYFEGRKLTKDEIDDMVVPYKPVSKKEKTTLPTDNVRLLYVTNFYWVEIDGVQYKLEQ